MGAEDGHSEEISGTLNVDRGVGRMIKARRSTERGVVMAGLSFLAPPLPPPSFPPKR